ncbi:MAG TPA: hypothetical protein DCM31_02640 [Deferribacteraceae bacterium]|nr:hypothetical protein [Deferribacteraceae bacterium]
MKKALLLAFIVLTTGCATRFRDIPAEVSIIDLPEKNQEHTVELGEPLVKKVKQHQYAGINLQNAVEGYDIWTGHTYFLKPMLLAARSEDDKWICYSADKLEARKTFVGSWMSRGGIAFNKDNETQVQFCTDRITIAPVEPKPVFYKMKIVDYSQPGFEQELIYNGRSGNILKFLYREYQYNRVRDAFSQEIQYDLKDGNLIGFKGVRLEVIEASNTRITYRVISSFPDPLY